MRITSYLGYVLLLFALIVPPVFLARCVRIVTPYALAMSSDVSRSPGSTGTENPPHINYTDINVGSNTGGDTGNGVYVRVFGTNFRSSQGSSLLMLGGKLITNCTLCSWTNNQIVAQLGPAAKTGEIYVDIAGIHSNGVPFTVTPTTILFVAANGSDSNRGTYAKPFKTWRAAFNAVTGNDSYPPQQNTVIYLEPGAAVNFDDGRGYSAVLSTDLGGTSAIKQLSIVGFPGGTVNVGSPSVTYGVHGWGSYITIANLTIVGQVSAIDAERGNVRIVNNNLSCPSPPTGVGGAACILAETENPTDTWVFQGNTVHDTGGNVDKTYHAIYFSSNTNHVEFGWNSIGANFRGYCRSLLFHATTGANLFDLHVHDNQIVGGYCDAISFASVNPSAGTVEAYNNVIAHVAIASNPYGVANEAGIAINSDASPKASGTVYAYNNTVIEAGGYTTGQQNGCFGVVSPGVSLVLTNNICMQPNSAQPYIEPNSTGISGTNNLWYGAGPAPRFDPHPVTLAPRFASATGFALQTESPAHAAGSRAQAPTFDIIGIQRGSAPSIGAYE